MRKLVLTLGLVGGLTITSSAGETLRLKLEPDRGVVLKGSPQEVVVKIDLAAASDRRRTKRTPLNLAVVLDRSGSMTGAKIEKARQAAMELVDHLGPDDIFSVVTYESTVQVLVAAQRVADKDFLKSRIARIQPGGSTALHAGVKTGADQLREHLSSRRINRVILLSDGLANVGPSSTQDLRRLGQSLARDGIAVTTIGLGDDYNEDLMAGLAEASDANYYYVKDTEKLPWIFARELGEMLAVAAREVRVEIICPSGVRPIGLLGRAEKFENQRATVKLSQFAVGQNRPLYLRCLVENAEPEIARIKVSYLDELDGGTAQSAGGVVKIRFTDDHALSARSANPAVIAEKELMLAALTKDEVLAAADAGKYQEAAAKCLEQASALDARCASAPPELQIQLRQESAAFRTRGEQLQQGQYDSSFRKHMQNESYNSRNSK